MANISEWSTTAANNNSAAPNGFPENMAPSGVNDAARETMAAVRRFADDGGWHDWGHTCTYASATSFTVPTDLRAIYAVGQRIRAVGATTGTIYGTISASTYSSPNTTVTVAWDSGSLSSETLTISVSLIDLNHKYVQPNTLQNQSYSSADADGTVNAITAAFTPPIAALTDKMMLRVISAGANTYVLVDIEGMSRASSCVITWTAHGLATDDYVQFSGITQADWTALNGNIYKLTKINDNSFSIPINTAGYAADYDAGTDDGKITITPTFNPDGLGAEPIVKGSNQVILAGDIPGANYPIHLVRSSTLGRWVFTTPAYPVSENNQYIYYAILQNRQTQNTGGGTATTGSWLIVPLNTEYEDADSIVDSTALPAFSLGAGTYRIQASLPFSSPCQLTQCRLYNVTDGAVQQNVGSLDMYSSSDSYTANDSGVRKIIIGTFTIAATKQLRIEYSCAVTVATTGHGLPANQGPEIYAQVEITKIA